MKRRRLLQALALAPIFNKKSFGANKETTEFVYDATNNTILYQKKDSKDIIPASLTKIMTIKILLEAFDKNILSPESELLISDNAKRKKPSNLNIKNIDKISAYDCLNALIVHSANDAACIIAENLSGSEKNFTKIMNKKTEEFELNNTRFSDASGLSLENQSTSYDITRLSTLLYYRHPQYHPLFQQKNWEWNKKIFKNHNHLIGKMGVDFGKTGYLKASGFHIMLSTYLKNTRFFITLTGFDTQKERDDRATFILSELKKT